MHSDIQRILLSEEQIKAAVSQMGEQITADYRGRNLMLVGVLKGSVVFMADLMRAVALPVTVDFISVSSYGNSDSSSGVVRILKDLDRPLGAYDILLVEDILDTGLTLSYLKRHMAAKGARSIGIAALLDKPDRRKTQVTPDYRGFEIPDEFVVGYGLDYDERYRNLPYVGVLKSEMAQASKGGCAV